MTVTDAQCPLCRGPLSPGFAERWKIEDKLGAGSMKARWKWRFVAVSGWGGLR